VTFELTEQEHKNLNIFLTEMVIFPSGNRKQIIPQMRELDRLLQIFNPQPKNLAPKKPTPGKIQKSQKNAEKKNIV